MIIWADGLVTEVRDSWAGAVEIIASRGDDQQLVRALAYTDLIRRRPSATGYCSTSRRSTAAWARAATHW